MKIVVRLPIPEGNPGDTVDVSGHRADALVEGNYARYAEEESYATAPAEKAPEAPAQEDSGEGIVTELPSTDDLKSDWVRAAKSLGIETKDKTKAELVKGFLTYVVSDAGQQEAADNAGSAPIPASFAERVKALRDTASAAKPLSGESGL